MITIEELSGSLKDYLKNLNGVDRKDNIVHHIDNSMVSFESKDGCVDNITIKGETLNNIITSLYRINGSDPDGVVRTRFSSVDDTYNSNARLSTGTWTFYNMSDKPIVFVSVNKENNWEGSVVGRVAPKSHKTVTLDGNLAIVGVDFQPSDGWSNGDLSVYNESLIMVVQGEHGDLPYFKGITNLGHGDKLSVITCGGKPVNTVWTDNKYIKTVDGELVDIQNHAVSDYIEIEGETEYTLSNANAYVCYFNESKQVISTEVNSTSICHVQTLGRNIPDDCGIYTIKTPVGAKYMRCTTITTAKNEFRVSKGYELSKVEFSSTGRSLPNGLCDLIVKKNNRYYKVTNCIEFDLYNVAKDCTIKFEKENDISVKPMITGIIDKIGGYVNGNNFNIFCEKTNVKNIYESTILQEGIYATSNIHHRVFKSRLSSLDTNGYLQYIQQNPHTIIIQTKEPIIEEVYGVSLRTFEGKTIIAVDSGKVPVNTDVEVTNSIRNEINLILDIVNSLGDGVKEAFQAGDNVKQKLVDKLISIGVNEASTNNGFDELINKIEGEKHKIPSWVGEHIWLDAARPSNQISEFSVCTDGDKAYLVGGHPVSSPSGNNHSITVYDPKTNTWTVNAGDAYGLGSFKTIIVNTRLYVIGGYYASGTQCVDLLTGTKTGYPGITTSSGGRELGNFGCEYDRISGIHCIGGYDGSYFSTHHVFDVLTNTWTKKSNAPQACYGTAAHYYNGKIYCIGNNYSSSGSSFNMVFDVANSTWDFKADPPVTGGGFCTGMLDDCVYLYGNSREFHKYNIPNNTWETYDKLPFDTASYPYGIGVGNALCYFFEKDTKVLYL